MEIKKVCHIETLYKIGHYNDLRKYSEPDFEEKKLKNRNRIFFLDAPSYGNLGDQAIVFVMKNYMKKLLPNFEQFEIQEDNFSKYFRWLKENLRSSDILCLTGGGKYGD